MQRNLLPRKSPEEFGLLGGNQVMFRTFCLLGLLVAASGCAAVTAPVETAPPPSVTQAAPPQQAIPPQPAASSQPTPAPVSQSVAARQAAIKPQAANVTAPVASASRQAPQQQTINAAPPEAAAVPPAAQAEIPPPAQTVAPVGAAAPIAPAAKEAETAPAPAPASALPAETAKPGLSPAALALVDYWYIGLGLIVLLLILLSLLARRRDPPADKATEPAVLQTGEPAPSETTEPTQDAAIDPAPSEAAEAAQHAEIEPAPSETTEPAPHAETEPPQQPVVLPPPPVSPANGGNGAHGKNGTNGAHGIEPLFANTSVAIGRDNEFCAVRFINPARVPTTFESDCLVVAVEHALPSTPHYPAEAVERLEHPVSVEAGQPFSIKRPNRVSAQDWERIQRGEAALWLYGYFDYRDAHQTLRRQGFCYAYLPSPSAASFPPGNGRVTTMMGPRAYNYVTALGRDAYPKEALDLAGVELREHQAD
jgi:hypothetical protein